MPDTVEASASKHGIPSEQNILLEEYQNIVEDVKRELHQCKIEQNNIRSELQVLLNENQNTNQIRQSFEHIHLEECCNEDSHKNALTNLQERISLLQAEKDSAVQLWHISLNTIDVLEEELKGFRGNGKGIKFYQEQANVLKETYSEAIKTLEGKLMQAKDNFLKQQALCQTNKEKIESLIKERDDIMHKFESLQREAQDKDRNNQLTIETLKKELCLARAETNKVTELKLELERKLNEIKRFAENVVERDKETKVKMAEAIELIETAVREKDIVLHREALIVEEKARLERRIATIANEYDTRIQDISAKSKDELEINAKKYLIDIKELKTELQEKTVMLDKVQREFKLMEQELETVRRDSNAKIFDYEQQVKQMELQLLVHNENKHETEIEQLKQKISSLEEKLHKLEHQTSNIKDHVKSNKNSKDLMKRYANLESQLAKPLGDKEDLVLQLQSLKFDFDREIQKRDNERHSLETKIHTMEVNLRKANSTKENQYNGLTEEVNPCHEERSKRTLDIKVESKCHCCQSVLSDHISKLQEKFDRKIKELTHHVHVHQKLSKRWRDEAKDLTVRFQGKTKELRAKLSILQKENNELNKQLSACRHQVAQYTVQDIQRCNEANEIR